MITSLGNDYFNSEAEATIDENYFINVGKRVGMSEKFNQCVSKHQKSKAVEELGDTANRKIGGAGGSGGVPYAKFGKYTSNGFDQSWGWNKFKQMMDAGL